MLRLAMVAAGIALSCARAPAAVQTAPDANQLLRVACVRALANLDPDRVEAEPPTALLPVVLEPTLRALHGTGMGGRVAALDIALERAARLALRDEQPWLDGAVASFAPATPPADGDGGQSGSFRTAHEAELRARLTLVAGPALESAGAHAALDSVRIGAGQLPLRRPVELDLVSVVTERALVHFFAALAEQEKALRQERAALRDGYGDAPNSGSLESPEEPGGSR
jgi:hypothetical protein